MQWCSRGTCAPHGGEWHEGMKAPAASDGRHPVSGSHCSSTASPRGSQPLEVSACWPHPETSSKSNFLRALGLSLGGKSDPNRLHWQNHRPSHTASSPPLKSSRSAPGPTLKTRDKEQESPALATSHKKPSPQGERPSAATRLPHQGCGSAHPQRTLSTLD